MYAADAYGKVAGKLGKHDVIVLADCLWMPSQHANLTRTIAQALDEGPDCCAIVVAGFHTGRGVVRDFFDVASGAADGEVMDRENEADSVSMARVEKGQQSPRLKVEEIYEVDVNGQRRDWQKARPGEGKEEAKKWCVVAVLLPP
jgi:nicotinamide N-methyltransferase